MQEQVELDVTTLNEAQETVVRIARAWSGKLDGCKLNVAKSTLQGNDAITYFLIF